MAVLTIVVAKLAENCPETGTMRVVPVVIAACTVEVTVMLEVHVAVGTATFTFNTGVVLMRSEEEACMVEGSGAEAVGMTSLQNLLDVAICNFSWLDLPSRLVSDLTLESPLATAPGLPSRLVSDLTLESPSATEAELAPGLLTRLGSVLILPTSVLLDTSMSDIAGDAKGVGIQVVGLTTRGLGSGWKVEARAFALRESFSAFPEDKEGIAG